jgi:hypothetical protein
MTTAIRTGLINLARRIGSWILRHLAAHGIDLLLGYMNGKIGDFCRRQARARTARRMTWLAGRIRRWQAAVAWLKAKRDQLIDKTAAEFSLLADHAEKKLGLPVVAKESEAA